MPPILPTSKRFPNPTENHSGIYAAWSHLRPNAGFSQTSKELTQSIAAPPGVNMSAVCHEIAAIFAALEPAIEALTDTPFLTSQ
jgi:hypothetical protein